MIQLRADVRDLLRGSEYSYLISNYLSAVSTVQVDNSEGFSASDYLLFGNFGSEQSEIIKLTSVTAATHTLNLASATKFSHAESTRITVIPYNQVKYYQTAAATFSSSENYLGVEDIEADSFFTTYKDTTNTTGYGWYVFYNETTAKASTNSNAMPYAGFNSSSVMEILDDFYSRLNNNELKLIKRKDAFRWLNQSYSEAKNELNLVSADANVPAEWSFTVTASDSGRESDLPTNFSDLISVSTEDGDEIGEINLANKRDNDENGGATNIKYYIRENTIGISPIPSASTTYYVFYKKGSTILTSYYDEIDLVDKNYFFLIEGMLAQAADKLSRINKKTHEEKFEKGIAKMKITSHKRDASLDTWGIAKNCNI